MADKFHGIFSLTGMKRYVGALESWYKEGNRSWFFMETMLSWQVLTSMLYRKCGMSLLW